MSNDTYIDLFGEVRRWRDIPAPERNAKYKPYPHGWAGHPGQGPEGETCNTCEFKIKLKSGSKKFYKCIKAKHRWTNSVNTDITLKTAACEYFERALSKTMRRLGLGLQRRGVFESKPLP